jgi:hypothetical protein
MVKGKALEKLENSEIKDCVSDDSSDFEKL